jgi:hypothetical protein
VLPPRAFAETRGDACVVRLPTRPTQGLHGDTTRSPTHSRTDPTH